MIRIGTRIGKYVVGHQIGEGGISDVFEAIDESLYGRKVAIESLKYKFLDDPSSIKRFQMEVEILSSLHHNNILEIREAGVFQNIPYFVAELLTGQDLKKYLLINGPISLDMLTNIFIQVLNALQYAHAQGVCHRDIKPSNIFLNRAKLVKLLDFGIAKDTHLINDLSNSRDIMGSPPYMSPEQILNDSPIDHRSDLYSLGVTLYTMIEGDHPYINIPSIYALHNEIIEHRLPMLSRCLEFQQVVSRATEKKTGEPLPVSRGVQIGFHSSLPIIATRSPDKSYQVEKKTSAKKNRLPNAITEIIFTFSGSRMRVDDFI